jgi:hypothetical protein
MSGLFPSRPVLEPVVALSIQTRAVRSVPGAPLGERMVFDITGGTFEGSRLRGTVLATGGDWVTRTPSGSRLDVRLVLETEDGVGILLQYSGRASRNSAGTRIDVAGTFEAPAGAYEWLNDVQAFGRGVHGADSVRYEFYRFE